MAPKKLAEDLISELEIVTPGVGTPVRKLWAAMCRRFWWAARSPPAPRCS